MFTRSAAAVIAATVTTGVIVVAALTHLRRARQIAQRIAELRFNLRPAEYPGCCGSLELARRLCTLERLAQFHATGRVGDKDAARGAVFLRQVHDLGLLALLRALATHDAVFGPAPDGGYWLIGLGPRPAPPGFLKGVRWSGPHALTDSRATLGDQRIAQLDLLADVDCAEDLLRGKIAVDDPIR